MAVTANTSMGLSGVHIGWKPRIGDGEDCSATATTTTATRRVDCIPPGDDGNTRAFHWHSVHVRGFLVQCGRMAMTMSNGPLDDDEKGGNNEIYGATTTFF